MCHAIQGTAAGGLVGPDLTHVASRQLLAAGAIPNVPGHLAGWIIDPQKIKPGAKMPQNNLSAADLRALLEYLESLK
jgi:cytochrome c oxidase subunit 2